MREIIIIFIKIININENYLQYKNEERALKKHKYAQAAFKNVQGKGEARCLNSNAYINS